MKKGAADKKAIERIVIRRARELGNRIKSHEITCEFPDEEIAPGCRIFKAHWVSGGALRSIAGLLLDNEAPDTYPAQALGKIFRRWLQTEKHLPGPEVMVRVVASIYDPSGFNDIIMSEEDKSLLIDLPEWITYVTLPEEIEVSGQPGISFWHTGPLGLSRMRIWLSGDGRIRTEERYIQDVISDKTSSII